MATVKLNSNSKLGTLVMYSLKQDCKVGYYDMYDLQAKYNVPRELIPDQQSKQGAFQKATTLVAGRVVRNQSPVLCKEIIVDKYRIVRTFEKRVVDTEESKEIISEGKQNIPVYEHIATMIFDKGTQTINTRVLRPEGEQVVQDSLKNYNELCDGMHIALIRKMIQKAFDHYGSIKLRHNGGVNFIPQENSKEFDRFCNLCNNIEGVDIMTLEIKYSSNNKGTIAEALDNTINDSIEDEIKKLDGKTTGNKMLTELVADFSELINNKSVHKEALASAITRFDKTLKIVKQYQELLEIDLSQTEAQVNIAKAQVVKLLALKEEKEEKKKEKKEKEVA